MARSMANVIPMKAYYYLVSDIPRKINAGPHHIKPGKRSQSNLFRRAKFFAVTADIYFRDFALIWHADISDTKRSFSAAQEFLVRKCLDLKLGCWR